MSGSTIASLSDTACGLPTPGSQSPCNPVIRRSTLASWNFPPVGRSGASTTPSGPYTEAASHDAPEYRLSVTSRTGTSGPRIRNSSVSPCAAQAASWGNGFAMATLVIGGVTSLRGSKPLVGNTNAVSYTHL